MNEIEMMYIWDKKPSNIYGLKYIPTTEPKYSDKEQRMFVRNGNGIDLPMCLESNKGGYRPLVSTGHSVRQSHLNLVENSISKNTKCILEIGVNHYAAPLPSTTTTILNKKAKECLYLGIDIRDKDRLNNPEENTHIMRISSSHREDIRNKLVALGGLTIDLLIIDGDHSIDLTVNDWQFTEFLSESGIVLIHDTNIHIGPLTVFDAIDETIFTKKRIGTEWIGNDPNSRKFTDYGMAIIRKIS